jgi:hypothetical protein
MRKVLAPLEALHPPVVAPADESDENAQTTAILVVLWADLARDAVTEQVLQWPLAQATPVPILAPHAGSA